MSFRAKTREWKRRLVHLLVVVLLLNNVYCLPVMAQTDGQAMLPAGDVLESVSGGDEVVNDVPEEQTEGEDVQADLSEGNVSDDLLGESMPVEEIVVENFMEPQPTVEETVVEENTPWGGTATELQVGEKVCGLSGTENFTETNCVDGHGFKVEFVEKGTYALELSTYGTVTYWLDDYRTGSAVVYTNSVKLSVTEPKTCYLYIKGSGAFDITLYKVQDIDNINLLSSKNIFYYEIERMMFSYAIPYFQITTKAGNVEFCSEGSFCWDKYDLQYWILDEDGNQVQYMSNGKYPVGKYTFVVEQKGNSDIHAEAHVEVVSIDDDAIELGLGESVTGLSACDNYDYTDYEGGYWFKAQLDGAGTYIIEKSAAGMMEYKYVEGGGACSYSTTTMELTIAEPKTCYIYAKGSEEFEITLRKLDEQLAIVELRPTVVRDEFYYEIENMTLGNAVSQIEIIFEDGNVETCIPYDEVWYKYNLDYWFLDEEGNWPQSDDKGKYPVGNYTILIEQRNNEYANVEIPFEIVSLDSIATELKPGETISNLNGCDNYNSYDYEGGHWFKAELNEAGNYILSKNSSGMLMYLFDGGTGSGHSDTLSMEWNISEPQKCFFYAKGSEDFELTLTKQPKVVEFRPVIERDIFYYEVESMCEWDIVYNIEVLLEDATTETCYFYDDVWDKYSLNCYIRDENGDNAQCDNDGKFPIGKYTLVINQSNNTQTSVTIPFEIVSINDVATELRLGETVSDLEACDNFDSYDYVGGHWFKAELIERGTYIISKNSSGVLRYTMSDGSDYSSGNTDSMTVNVSESKTCYIYAKGSEDFEVTLTKQPEVVEIRPISIVKDRFYYEIEYVGVHAISQLELVLDDGTVETCEPYDSVWNKHSLQERILDAEGNGVQYDENGRNRIGSYTIIIYPWGNENVKTEIPVEVVSIDEVVIELQPGQTVSDLSPCDNYTSYNYEGGHWFKAELEEGVNYIISKSASGMFEIQIPGVTCGGSSNTKSWDIDGAKQAVYYFYAKGDEVFEITLCSPKDESMEINIGETISGLAGCSNYLNYEYNGGHWIKANLEKTGTYALTKTAAGNIQYRYPNWDYSSKWDCTYLNLLVSEPGTYYFYVKGNETFDVTMLFVDDIVADIEVGETITGLSPNSDPENMETLYDAHIYKVDIEEPGNYLFSKTTNGMIYVEEKGGFGSGVSWSKEHTVKVTQPNTYYIYVKGYDTFDLTVKRMPDLISMRANVKKDIVYYEFGEGYFDDVIESLELTFEDGTVVDCGYWDDYWRKYQLYDMWTDEDGYYPATDETYRYPEGTYKFSVGVSGTDIGCEVSYKIVSITDESVVVPEFTTEPIDFTEALTQGVYKLNITKSGAYKIDVDGPLSYYCYAYIYDENCRWLTGYAFNANNNDLGTLEPGNYYIRFVADYSVPEGVTIKLARLPELDTLEYNGSDIVWKYGEWGYRLENVVSGNYVSTATLSSNLALSDNRYINVVMPIKLEGTLTDGSNIEIPFNQYMQVWLNYKLDYKICKADGTTAYTDRNGYLANGDYLLVVTSGYGSARVEIPFKVTGGPVVPSSWTYSGATQEFKYGTWGYNMSQVLSGNKIDTPTAPNTDLNRILSGNNVLALDFKVTAKSDDGQTDTVSYRSKAWNLYRIKTYFYDAEGNSVRTDQNGYIPEGSYVMKCVAYNGTEFEIPLKVYKDAGDIAEEQLSTAVDEMLTEAEKLTDENLAEATEEEKKTVVEEVLQKVEEIYENQEIAEIGAADADKAIELAEKLEEVEKQIEELLNTSVTVVPQDNEAVEIEVQVKNALLSVPAGENAQIKVTTAEVPENIPVEKENAAAIQLELVAESEEKMQLNAPVVVTVKVPEGIDTNEEIWVYHFADLQEKAKEIIKAKLNGDGTLSFVTGSFSTFVIANAAKGASVSGKVVSFGDEAEEVTIKVLNGDKMVVAETVSAADTGAYQFEQLEAGEYTLVFSKSNHVEREYSITVAEENVVLDAEIYLLGDVDGNDRINARDKKTIYNHIAGESELTGYDFQVGDVNGDGRINARDKKMIYNHIAGEDLLW